MSAKLMGRAMEFDMGASDKLRWVLMGICDAADPDGSNVYPGITKLRRIARCSKRQAIRALNMLEASGLLVRVADASQHRPTEYRIDLDVFSDVERDGFAIVLDRAEARAQEGGGETDDDGARGDTTSPLDDEDEESREDARGDSMSPLRGDTMAPLNSGASGDISEARGDISSRSGVTSARGSLSGPPIDPPIDPERERALRARAINEVGSDAGKERPEPEGRPEDDPVFQKLVHDFPGVQVVNRCWPVWRKLDDEARARAVERIEVYVAAQHNVGRKALHSLETYLRNRLFDQVDAPGGDGARFDLKLKSRDWWITFHERRVSHDVDPETRQPLRRKAKTMLDLFARQHRIGVVVKALPAPELIERYVKVERGSQQFQAWAQHLRGEGFDIDNDTVCGAWIWVPARAGCSPDDPNRAWPKGHEPSALGLSVEDEIEAGGL